MSDHGTSSLNPMDDSFDDSFDFNGSDEGMDWEEIEVPVVTTTEAPTRASSVVKKTDSSSRRSDALEITLKTVSKKKDNALAKQRAAAIQAERMARLTCHKLHTVALLSNALTRNKWINDRLLQARLLSLVPLPIQTSFSSITKDRHPEPAKRGRLFETALMRLTQWWYESFEVTDSGHVRSRTFREVQKLIETGEYLQEDGELIRSSKSLMKHALMWQGCRDTSAQLFTSLCRALRIPARLVVSLQSVPWQANVGEPKSKGSTRSKKGKEKASSPFENDTMDEDEDMEEVAIPSSSSTSGNMRFPGDGNSLSGTHSPSKKGKEKALPKPVIKLRKQKAKGQRLGSSSTISTRQTTPAPPIGGYPPVFWTEVFSRPDGRWMPVDPIRYIVNKRKVFEPPPHDKSNRMVYVVAVEEDGYARDVTPRYAREYGARTTKVQLGGKGKKEWWENIMAQVTRPFRLNRDDVEDEEFEFHQFTEGMPTSVVGFKDHPLYVLEQHLKREEVIFPKEEVGKFRGESVYPRSNVIAMKTAENWMRSGRKVREGCQALKLVKQRAVTVHRRRAMELAQQDGEEVLQGLYSESQTELFVPDPVVNGVVPKNDFGNIDLYVPSMLPAGAAHVPFKGAAKIAKKLGFDYAEAVTSFEFKKGRAFPVLSGIVIAVENEEALLEAYWETERDNEEKERTKRMERVLKRWTRLIQAMRIRQRLREQYAAGATGPGNDVSQGDEPQQLEGLAIDTELPGGFLTEADSVVQPFQLPKYQHPVYQPPEHNDAGSSLSGDEGVEDRPEEQNDEDKPFTPGSLESTQGAGEYMVAESDAPNAIDQRSSLANEQAAPKTMREYAEQMKLATSNGNSNLDANITRVQGLQTKVATSSNAEAEPDTSQDTGRQQMISTIKTKGKNARSSKTPIRSTSARTRGRKNARQLDGEGGGEDSTELSNLPAEEEAEPTPSTGNSRKRKRPESVKVTVTPTRVLRSRVPKSAEKLQVEREAEEAFRRAVED